MDTQIEQVLLQRGLSDLVQLSEVAWLVRSVLGVDKEVQTATLDVLSRLLEKALVELGDVELVDDRVHFLPWQGTPQEQLARLRAAWSELGRLPMLGEVCWMRNTASGDAMAAFGTRL